MNEQEIAHCRGNLALAMAAQGFSYTAIGRALGVSYKRAIQIKNAHECRARNLHRIGLADVIELGGVLLTDHRTLQLVVAPEFENLAWRIATGRLVLPNVRAKPRVLASAKNAHDPGTRVLWGGARRGSAAWPTSALVRLACGRVACS